MSDNKIVLDVIEYDLSDNSSSPKSITSDEELYINRKKSNSNTYSSQDDAFRKELLWEKREEEIFVKWLKDCRIKSEKHQRKFKLCKIKYGVCSIPAITIPVIVSGLSSKISCDSFENSVLMIIATLFACINTFFNFGARQEKHEQYSNKYFELATEIEAELSKPKRFRIACDVYLEKIKQKYNNLYATEPEL